MFPSEAIMASIDLKSEYFMPIHWGGFTLSMHPWDEPVIESKRIADERGLNCLTPEIGEVLSRKKLNKKFLISCNKNAKKRLGENKACIKMVDDMNIVMKND